MRSYIFFIRLVFINLLILVVAFVLTVCIKPDSSCASYKGYYQPFLLLSAIWLMASFGLRKYQWGLLHSKEHLLRNIVLTGIMSPAIVSMLFVLLSVTHVSRFVLFGTSLLTVFFEVIVYGLLYGILYSKNVSVSLESPSNQKAQPERINPEESRAEIRRKSVHIEDFVREECGLGLLNTLKSHVDIYHTQTLMLSTTTRFNVLKQADDFFLSIVNLQRINDIRYMNKFFEAVNGKLPVGGTFIGCAQTKELRKSRILKKFPPVLNIVYYSFDYIFKRLFPKFALTKWLYFALTAGRNRVISRAEVLGRLSSCGFSIEEEGVVDHVFYFVVKKVRTPFYDMNPTYGAFIKLRRIGKGGRAFNVYKFRTMHPFSEYLQAYVYQLNQLDEGGKMKNDFRITTLGRLMRKLWIDEWPMLINLLKGDMKLVGVRPLSKHYFALYAEETQRIRTLVKPGLIPPFYADSPKTLEEIQSSEIKYVKTYLKHPWMTDIRYFFRVLYNIVVKGARSS